MARKLLGPLALLGLCAGGSVAHATVSIPLSVAALTREADVIVRGKVLDQVSLWDPLKGSIYTHTRVEVLGTLKGQATDREILVRQMGGRVGNYVMKVSGNARLKPGEEVVLFLTRDAQYHYVVGLAQGKYSVEADASGRKRLVRDTTGLTFASWNAQGKMILGKRWELARPLYLDELEALVKRAITSK